MTLTAKILPVGQFPLILLGLICEVNREADLAYFTEGRPRKTFANPQMQCSVSNVFPFPSRVFLPDSIFVEASNTKSTT